MAEGWSGAERRRHPRVSLNGEVRGRIHTVASAPVVNISVSGALLEVPCTLQIGALYTLRLTIQQGEVLEIKGKIIRSYVHGFAKNEKGETVIKYRAAVQYQSLSDPNRYALETFLRNVEKRGLKAELQASPSR
jgi:hypothetical protein